MSMRPFPEISKHVKGCLSLNYRHSASRGVPFFIVEKSVVMVYNKLLNFVGVTGRSRNAGCACEGNSMKKKLSLIISLVIVAVMVVVVIALSRPYKPTSFVADGEIFSATVENGSTLILDLDNDSKSREWSITQTPECFTSDFSTVTENCSEFHIIALHDGKGVMVFQCVLDDGTVEDYELTLSISRHQKTYLQIDSVSFEKTAVR